MEIDLCCDYSKGLHWSVLDVIMSIPMELDEIEEDMNHAFKEVCKIVLD